MKSLLPKRASAHLIGCLANTPTSFCWERGATARQIFSVTDRAPALEFLSKLPSLSSRTHTPTSQHHPAHRRTNTYKSYLRHHKNTANSLLIDSSIFNHYSATKPPISRCFHEDSESPPGERSPHPSDQPLPASPGSSHRQSLSALHALITRRSSTTTHGRGTSVL